MTSHRISSLAIYTVVVTAIAALAAACSQGENGSPANGLNDNSTASDSKIATPSPAGEPVPTPGALYAFGIGELIDLQRRALSGDGDAAYAISQYYSLRKQWTESDLWARIGAENGGAIAAEMVARDLYRLGGFHNCLRAVFWLRKSQAAFDAMNAKSQVIDLSDLVAEIEQNDERCMWGELDQDKSMPPPKD